MFRSITDLSIFPDISTESVDSPPVEGLRIYVEIRSNGVKDGTWLLHHGFLLLFGSWVLVNSCRMSAGVQKAKGLVWFSHRSHE